MIRTLSRASSSVNFWIQTRSAETHGHSSFCGEGSPPPPDGFMGDLAVTWGPTPRRAYTWFSALQPLSQIPRNFGMKPSPCPLRPGPLVYMAGPASTLLHHPFSQSTDVVLLVGIAQNNLVSSLHETFLFVTPIFPCSWSPGEESRWHPRRSGS